MLQQAVANMLGTNDKVENLNKEIENLSKEIEDIKKS